MKLFQTRSFSKKVVQQETQAHQRKMSFWVKITFFSPQGCAFGSLRCESKELLLLYLSRKCNLPI